ncbi:heme/hemin ABC transporter substrate-binding protein [Sphingobacterium suaedae]|uniref:Hemin ABC transporter substrate-binding protein n=1 Tax=Sphingobacterium suaedae TaxID=1686402 RepID=A0ABW5KGE9_9SPHI
MKKLYISWLLFMILCNQTVCARIQRIVTLNSAITETVFGLGMGRAVVATDVTSIAPKAAADLPKVSRNRALSAEGILAFRPTLVIAPIGDVPNAVVQQLKASGIKFIAIHQEFSENGAYRFIQQIANVLEAEDEGKRVVNRTRVTMHKVKELVRTKMTNRPKPKILFIYARGAGTMSVSGKGSSIDALMDLAGNENAVKEFNDFKPYTTEALVHANPDVILMFDFGVSSLGGKDAILRLPGMRLTTAGRHGRILSMNPSLLVNFSTRLPEAVLALHQGVVNIMDQ